MNFHKNGHENDENLTSKLKTNKLKIEKKTNYIEKQNKNEKNCGSVKNKIVINIFWNLFFNILFIIASVWFENKL